MMSDSYCTVEWGSCSQCYSYQGFDLNFFTFNFYPCSEHVNSTHASEIQSGSKVLQSATTAELSSSIKRTTANSTEPYKYQGAENVTFVKLTDCPYSCACSGQTDCKCAAGPGWYQCICAGP